MRILRQLSFKRVRSAQKSVKPNFERVGTEELKFSVIAGSIAKQESLLRSELLTFAPAEKPDDRSRTFDCVKSDIKDVGG